MRALMSLAMAACLAAVGAQAAVLKVSLNHLERLRLAGSAASVVVGDPAVADVTVVDSRTLFVSGKALGTTNVEVIDALGRTLLAAELVVDAPGRPVTVFRGSARDEMTCTSSCGSVGAAAGAGPAVAAAAAPASPLGGLMSGVGPSALGDAMAGFAGVAAAAAPSAPTVR